MNRKFSFAAGAIAVAISIAGCSNVQTATPPTEPTVVQETIDASSITSIEDGITWARSLDDDVEAPELSAGIQRIGELVPDLDIWFATSNEIGQDLISLNLDVLDAPADTGDHVEDLNEIVDNIEEAIAHGNAP